MHITIDLDSTVFNTYATIKMLCNAYNKRFTLPIRAYDFSDQHPETREFLLAAFRPPYLFFETLFMGELFNQRIPYIINGMTSSREHQVTFVSARPNTEDCKMMTKKQLCNTGIKVSTDRARLVLTGNKDKRATLKYLKSSLHIDDEESIITACIVDNIRHIMFSNRDQVHNHYLRPHVDMYTGSWPKIPGLIYKKPTDTLRMEIAALRESGQRAWRNNDMLLYSVLQSDLDALYAKLARPGRVISA